MNSAPLFSVIVTSYNRADMLRTALRSLAGQTLADYEVFVVDDASTDHTPRVAAEFSGRPLWHFIRLEANRGYPYAKNLVLPRCRGRYVTFLDSDDLWMPRRLQAFADHFSAHPEDGFVFSNGYIHAEGRIIGLMASPAARVPVGRLPAYMAVSNRWLPYVTTNVALSRAAVQAVGSYEESMVFLGDTEYFVRVLQRFPAGYIDEPLSIYRIHAVSLTRSWDRCLEESIISLERSAPPTGIRAEMVRMLYTNQAIFYFKNGNGVKSRECLEKIRPWSPRERLLAAVTVLPSPVIILCRHLYRAGRKLALAVRAPKSLSLAQHYLAEMERSSR